MLIWCYLQIDGIDMNHSIDFVIWYDGKLCARVFCCSFFSVMQIPNACDATMGIVIVRFVCVCVFPLIVMFLCCILNHLVPQVQSITYWNRFIVFQLHLPEDTSKIRPRSSTCPCLLWSPNQTQTCFQRLHLGHERFSRAMVGVLASACRLDELYVDVLVMSCVFTLVN